MFIKELTKENPKWYESYCPYKNFETVALYAYSLGFLKGPFIELEQEIEKSNAEIAEKSEESKSLFQYLQISEEGLTPNFTKNITDYSLAVGENVNSIEVLARSEDPNAKVEITGNEALKEGENLITILVTNEAGDKTAAYQIKLTKTLVDEEAIAREQELEKQEKNKKIIAIALVIAVIVIIAIVLIIRRIRNKKLAEEYGLRG